MRRETIIWIGVLAICLGGTIYEMPNAVLLLRYHRTLFMDVEDHVERVISDDLIAGDPEAGEILRYAIKRDAGYAGRWDLRVLVEEYPRNEFFLAELVERLAEKENADLSEMLAISDRLLALDPNNAHYRYLRGWVLLKAPGGKERIAEAMEQFEMGDRLPAFSLPYRKYKPRVDRIAEQAVLRKFDRPWIRTFYPDLGEIIARSPDWRSLDEEQLHRLIVAGSTTADRVIQNAYDDHSLYDGGRMMEKIEQTRLQKPGRSKSEDSHARARLEQARVIDDLWSRWDRGLWLTQPSMGNMMPLLMPVLLLIGLLRSRSDLASQQDAMKARARLSVAIGGVSLTASVAPAARDRSLAAFVWTSGFTLIALTVFLTLYARYRFASWAFLWLEIPWAMVWFSWADYSIALSDIGSAKDLSSRSIWFRCKVAYGLLWLNGTILLLISNSQFLWSGRFTGWPEGIPLLTVWLVFCAFLWFSAYDRQPVFGRVPYNMAVMTVVCWAGLLLALDAFGTHWHYESRAYAQPLTFCTPLPAAPQETGG